MTDTTKVAPSRIRDKIRARRRPSALQQRRRRRSTTHQVSPEAALHALMCDGDLYRVRGRHYLVAPVDRDLLELLIRAQGAVEDAEGNGDDEPSLGTEDDRESDGIDDDFRTGDMALGWAAEGSQAHLTGNSDESELELAWQNTGSQLRLAVQAGWSDVNAEGDGNCDAEDDDPGGGNVEDDGEAAGSWWGDAP